MKVRNTGLFVIHGELTGERTDFSASAEAPTILTLSRIVLGPLPRIPGLRVFVIRQLKLKKTTPGMTRQFMSSPSPPTMSQTNLSFPK